MKKQKRIKNERLQKKHDLFALVAFPMIAVLLSLTLNLNFLLSTLLFLGLPAVYLSIRTPAAVPRALAFACIFSFFGGIFFDHLAVHNNIWSVPTIFPFR